MISSAQSEYYNTHEAWLLLLEEGFIFIVAEFT